MLLLALVPVIGTSASFSPDEGAVLIQARSLAAGDGWVVDHPFADLDPDDRYYPLGGSSQGDAGKAPFAKHPVYAVVLAALERTGGVAGMVALSVLGTVGAAVAAAVLAREVSGPGAARPVLWAVGVGSPLVFDAYLLIAHSLGAALVGGATVFALRAVRGARPAVPVIACAALLGAAVLLRAEALIFAAALGTGVAGSGIAWHRPRLVIWAAALPGAGLGAAVGDRWLQRLVIGADGGGVSAPAVPGGFLQSRFEAFLNTWLRPSAGVPDGADLALLAAAVLVAIGVVVVRRRGSSRAIGAVALTAMGFSMLAFVADPARVVPGLVVAFPLAIVSLGLVDRSYADRDGRLLLSATAAVFVLGVLATQYREGGSAEWGGRYFALVVPVLAVIAVDAMARRAPTLSGEARRWAQCGLMVCSALLAVGAVTSLRSAHVFTDRLIQRIGATADSTVPGDGGDRPVVVSAYPNIPRLAWPTISAGRWLHSPDVADGAELATLLGGAGVAELVFVGQTSDDVAPYLDRYRLDPTRSFTMGRWEVTVLVHATVPAPSPSCCAVPAHTQSSVRMFGDRRSR